MPSDRPVGGLARGVAGAVAARCQRLLAHELKTPLASIVGYAEMLHRGIYGQLSDQQARAAEAIHRRALELSERMDDMHLMLRAQQGDAAGTPLTLEPDEQWTAWAPIWAGRAGGKAVVGPEVSDLRPILVDIRLLHRAMARLADVVCARAASRVTLSAAASDGWLRLEVRDDGPPLPDGLVRLLDPEAEAPPAEELEAAWLPWVIASTWLSAMGGALVAPPGAECGLAVLVLPRSDVTGPE